MFTCINCIFIFHSLGPTVQYSSISIPVSGGILRWACDVAHMPMSRAPMYLLTCWVSNSRLTDCPQMSLGRLLVNALKSKGITKEFDE